MSEPPRRRLASGCPKSRLPAQEGNIRYAYSHENWPLLGATGVSIRNSFSSNNLPAYPATRSLPSFLAKFLARSAFCSSSPSVRKQSLSATHKPIEAVSGLAVSWKRSAATRFWRPLMKVIAKSASALGINRAYSSPPKR